MAPELLVTRNLRREYPRRRSTALGSDTVRAVDGVDLAIARGTALGLVGETGSGKSTFARLVLALERPDRGSVDFAGHRISALPESKLRPLRRRIQAVFQDPVTSLNPRLRISTIVAEPLVAHHIGDREWRARRVLELLRMVGLPPDAAQRKPAAFSGGERQRIAIARALATEPDLLVLDEPVTALDVSVQHQILELLAWLRHQLGLTMILISHDLLVVRALCDELAVMYCGVIVEHGPTATVLSGPRHPYTRELIASTPGSHQSLSRAPTTDRSWPAEACRYASRCTETTQRCRTEPALLNAGDRHRVACWLVDRENATLPGS